MNSFIYQDSELIEKLIKIAQTPNDGRAKQIPEAPKPVVPVVPAGPTIQDYQLMQKLVNKLQAGKNEVDTVSTQNPEAATLEIAHLKNLDSLLSFLATNKIEVGYQIIAYAADNKHSYNKHSYLDKSQYPLTILDSGKEYFINKDLFAKYLQALQSENNPSINFYLPNLISEAQKLGTTSQQGHSTQQQNDSQLDQMLLNIASMPVLEASNINLNRIKTFIGEYSKFLALVQNRDPNDQQNIATINETIAALTNFTTANVFELNSVDSIQGFLKPVQSAFTQVIIGLFGIVNRVGSLMREFLDTYDGRLQSNHDVLNKFSQQITGGGSPLSRNLQSLVGLKQDAKHIDTPHSLGQ